MTIGGAVTGGSTAKQCIAPASADIRLLTTENREDTELMHPLTSYLGILGGVGPLATASLYRRIIELTAAQCDQDHFPVMILADPSTPDRSRALLDGDRERVREALLTRAQYLDKLGVGAIAMPCNTAHYWAAEIRSAIHCPLISIVESAAALAVAVAGHGARVLVLGTEATMRLGLYHHPLRCHGLEPADPTEDEIALMTRVIADVKAGELVRARQTMKAFLEARGADDAAAILACTELPIAAEGIQAGGPAMIDPSEALAEVCVNWLQAAREKHREPLPDSQAMAACS